jgi:hypothetical protein
MSKDFAFFQRESKKISADEAKRLNSPEAIGRDVILIARAWTEKALATMSRHPDIMPAVDLVMPYWLDLSLPDHAIHELHRICNQLPKYMPPESTLELLDQDEKNAVEVLYRIKQLGKTLSGLSVPASSAVVIINASLGLGTMAAKAHVDPWEPLAVSGWKSKAGGGTGGKSPKRRQWAEWASKRAGCWDKFPDSASPWEFNLNDMTVLEIYRDRDSLIAADPDTGKEYKLARSTIEKRYLKND